MSHTREHRIRISSVRRTVSRRKAWLVRQAFGISVVRALQFMAFVANGVGFPFEGRGAV